MRRKANTAIYKSKKLNTNPEFFIRVFQNRLHRTPNEYIEEKIKTGSKIDDIRYLFNVVAAEISLQNSCKHFDFDYFYSRRRYYNKGNPQNAPTKISTRPKNAGKLWSKEEEQLLIKMYESTTTKQEMCDRFERTERGLAARLVRLGIIEEREVFYKRK